MVEVQRTVYYPWISELTNSSYFDWSFPWSFMKSNNVVSKIDLAGYINWIKRFCKHKATLMVFSWFQLLFLDTTSNWIIETHSSHDCKNCKVAERFHLLINRYFWFLRGVRKMAENSPLPFQDRLDSAKIPTNQMAFQHNYTASSLN